MKWIKIFDQIDKASTSIPNNTSKLLIIGDHRICLSNVNNQFYAIQDNCPHNSESLSKGKINYLGEIVCPWHGYRFSMKTGQEGDHKCDDAKAYRVRMDEDGLYLLI